MKPGMHKIRNQEYHAGPGLSSSDLKELLKSAAHYKTYKANPPEQTAEMLRGSLVHQMILEPELFDQEYAVGSFNIRRGKEYEKVVAENPGKIVISSEELCEATKCVEAFKEECSKNKELSELFEGVKELAFYWEDKESGALLKAKPDVITKTGKIVDLKTARDASFDAFQKQMVDLKYFVSAAHYLNGVREVIGMEIEGTSIIPHPPNTFHFVVIETKAPYAIAVYTLDEKAIEFGNALISHAIRNFSEAIATDEWRGYPKRVVEIGLPPWCYYKMNYVTAQGT